MCFPDCLILTCTPASQFSFAKLAAWPRVGCARWGVTMPIAMEEWWQGCIRPQFCSTGSCLKARHRSTNKRLPGGSADSASSHQTHTPLILCTLTHTPPLSRCSKTHNSLSRCTNTHTHAFLFAQTHTQRSLCTNTHTPLSLHSVEFSSATKRCTPWRVDGQSHGETCRYKRGIRGCGSFRI